ncbi:MAG: Hsp20/alpha crystallin family protein [Candidatus Magasanikbacteria bacterium]|jgi:HSP20 family protein|nr:Hsp20/alpha crystallin family protein [Candidatus Magasanikbacteria bacterium]MBT4071689.1 Hsp20/alpha crystallin family protein [Candidatus Magasanikbacteria bacterium]
MSDVNIQQFEWKDHQHEGQLSIDVFDAGKDIIVIAPLAGVIQESLDISVHNDLMTIRGNRPSPIEDDASIHAYHTECFWGDFSRTVVLPVDVKGDIAKATYSNGILMVRIPKQQEDKKIHVTFVDD